MKQNVLYLCVVLAGGLFFTSCTEPLGSQSADGGSVDLKSLTVSSGILSPSFTANTTEYAVEVPHSVTQITITAETADYYAGCGVSAIDETNFPVSNVDTNYTDTIYTFNLPEDSYIEVSIGVMSRDFSSTKYYTVTITRLPQS